MPSLAQYEDLLASLQSGDEAFISLIVQAGGDAGRTPEECAPAPVPVVVGACRGSFNDLKMWQLKRAVAAS